MLKQVNVEASKNKVESYVLLSDMVDAAAESNDQQDQSLIVKRMNLTFNDKECQVINFTDITTYKRLKREEEKGRLLGTLNRSIHHEMLGPLKANVEVAENLIRHLDDPQCREMAQIIEISSKLILFHANDLLDQRFLQNGYFSP